MVIEQLRHTQMSMKDDFVVTATGVKSRRGFIEGVLHPHGTELLDADDFLVGEKKTRPREYWADPDFRRQVKEGRSRAGNGSLFFDDPLTLAHQALSNNWDVPLTGLQRTVLDMRFKRGLTQQETGEELGRSYKNVSHIERRALLKIHKEINGGFQEILKAEDLLVGGNLDVVSIPGLSDRERLLLRKRCKEQMTNIQAAGELGISPKNASESYRAAIQKAAMFVREFKLQAQQTHQSEQ